MGDVITVSKGKFWHFTPFKNLNNDEDAIKALHHDFVDHLKITPQSKVLEIGCGYGRNVRWLAKTTGAHIQGITLSPVEVQYINDRKRTDAIKNYDVCEGDYHEMHMFKDNSFDHVIAIYCLKYSNNLHKVLSEIQRVLKPGGRFLSYEILTTEKYDDNNQEHKNYVRNICTSTSMPPLHNINRFMDTAVNSGLDIDENTELSNGNDPWFKYFLATGTYQLVTSKIINGLIKFAERIKILQSGFNDFYNQCIVHPPRDFVEAGRLGIVTGSRLMIFRKSLKVNT